MPEDHVQPAAGASSSSLRTGRHEPLVWDVAVTARRLRLDVDRDAYAAAGRDPLRPVLFAGNLDARVCIVGRDLGRLEVLHGQPLVGPSGHAVRAAVLEALCQAPSSGDPLLEHALRHVLLTNLVPYKPPENRPFPAGVREAFRPYIERLLVCRFRGDQVLALGNDAFRWFFRYADACELERLRRSEGPAPLRCRLVAPCNAHLGSRVLYVWPLPHPSPANTRCKGRFAELCARCLRDALGP